jgi:hypothetical protein
LKAVTLIDAAPEAKDQKMGVRRNIFYIFSAPHYDYRTIFCNPAEKMPARNPQDVVGATGTLPMEGWPINVLNRYARRESCSSYWAS